MIKTLQFGEKQVSFSTSFAWCFIYKAQFHKDPAQVLIPVTKQVTSMQTQQEKPKKKSKAQEAEDNADYAYNLYELLGFVEIADIAWSMARLLDENIPEPIVWVASFGDDFDAMQIMLELIPEAIESCFSTKKSMVLIPTVTQKTAPTKN